VNLQDLFRSQNSEFNKHEAPDCISPIASRQESNNLSVDVNIFDPAFTGRHVAAILASLRL
jgi:hypothetical protein